MVLVQGGLVRFRCTVIHLGVSWRRMWHWDTIRAKKLSQTSSVMASQRCLRIALEGFKYWMKALSARHVTITGSSRFLCGGLNRELIPVFWGTGCYKFFFSVFALWRTPATAICGNVSVEVINLLLAFRSSEILALSQPELGRFLKGRGKGRGINFPLIA